MNYAYPIPGMQGNPASFVANTTLILGTYVKPLEARTQINVDYSALVPAVTLSNYSIRIKPGGEPQLWISNSIFNTDFTQVSFYLDGGIAGRAYELTINAIQANGEVRSDVLNVQVLDDGGYGCALVAPPSPPAGSVTSGDGSVTVNTAPRFFVSATIPVGANVLDRWYDTTTGETYDYISNGITSLWQVTGSGGGGGGGGGGGDGSNATILSITPIHPDGATTTFNLTSVVGRPVTITTANTLFVSVDGVWQDASTQYSAVNNQISFVQPPSIDSVVFMLWFAPYSPSI